MLQYARDNLIKMEIFVRDPYVTKYKRDVAMSWITWLSNTGK